MVKWNRLVPSRLLAFNVVVQPLFIEDERIVWPGPEKRQHSHAPLLGSFFSIELGQIQNSNQRFHRLHMFSRLWPMTRAKQDPSGTEGIPGSDGWLPLLRVPPACTSANGDPMQALASG